MNWHLVTALRPSREQNPRSTSSRRKARPRLEFLERREVLSTYTWIGADGSWDNASNWSVSDVGAPPTPTTGVVDIVLPATATPRTITVQGEDATMQIKSLTVQGGSYTLQGPTTDGNRIFQLADQAAFSIPTAGSTLAICPPTGTGANSLSLNILGSASLSGSGKLALNNTAVAYPGNPSALRTFTVQTSTVEIGADADYAKTKILFVTSGNLVVADGASPTVGSLEGKGNIQLGVGGGQTAATGLTVATPGGVTNLLDGDISGPGGTITKIGSGTFLVTTINAAQTGSHTLDIQAGNFGLQSTAYLTRFNIKQGASYSAVLLGPAPGQFGQLNVTGTTNPATLAGNLLLVVSNTYTPAVSQGFPLISSPNGVTGTFSNVGDGQVVLVGSNAFLIDYTTTGVGATSLTRTNTALVSSANPSPLGAALTFTATVTTGGNPVAGGTVTFLVGGVQLGNPVPVGPGGVAVSAPVSNLNLGNTEITARYSGQSGVYLSSSTTLTQTVSATVNQAQNTAITLQALGGATYVGQAASFLATVTSNGNPVTQGSVRFYANRNGQSVQVGTVPLDGQGRAVYSTTSLLPGATSFTAEYAGVTNAFRTSASGGVSQAVNAYPTSASLALTNESVVTRRRRQRTYFLTATIGTGVPGSPPVTGVVVFRNGTRLLGTVPVTNGVAKWSVGRNAPRSGSFTAEFSPTATFNGSKSNTLTYGRRRGGVRR
ncbi:MAG: Ig-like domain-containing protein [Isosphaeraceae bacterium]